MGLISKSNLQYNYSWTAIAGDNPKVTGEPDSTLFNRNEGYEVLYLINKLAELWSFKQKASCLKLEKMIKHHLPSDVRSQINVKKWLADNWENY
jgi:hypothetical protein